MRSSGIDLTAISEEMHKKFVIKIFFFFQLTHFKFLPHLSGNNELMTASSYDLLRVDYRKTKTSFFFQIVSCYIRIIYRLLEDKEMEHCRSKLSSSIHSSLSIHLALSTLKWLNNYFINAISISNVVHYKCNILVWHWSNILYISSALWLLMAWCFSTRASVDTVLNTLRCVSSCLRVEKGIINHNIAGLAQDCGNSTALVMELPVLWQTIGILLKQRIWHAISENYHVAC